MPRLQISKLVLASLLLSASCRRHERTEGAPTWSFGIPRGTTTDGSDGGAPIQLTASDGTGLKLTSLDAKIVLAGPLAFTELTMGFENPLDRTLEGHFDVVLPTGAAVSRFAMRLPAGWQEAEMVEKQAARVAYEDFLHRRQDPALLEKAAGNEFSARVFPIAPRAVKQIKLSYSEELPSQDEPYRLKLRGLGLLPDLQILVFVGQELVRVAKRKFVPDGDFLLERPHAGSGLQSGKLVVARLRPPLPVAPSTMKGVVLLFDTSASRTSGFARQVSELGALVAELRRAHGDALPLQVAAFDQEVTPIYSGATGGFAADAKALLDGLTARGALGASDFAGALSWAAHSRGGDHQRLILLTDGVATASAGVVAEKIEEAGDDAIATVRAVDGLKTRFDRLDVILGGGIRDDTAMRSLCAGHLAEDGALLDGSEGAERLVRHLDDKALSGVRVGVDGAAWVWPTTVSGMQRGDDLIVYAEMVDGRSRDAVFVTLSGPVSLRTEVPLASPDGKGLRPLVERAWARARIAGLTVEAAAVPPAEHDHAAVVRREIVDLSTRYRVLSDFTSLLVLESDADYARFHIDRRALADILVVSEGGLRLEQRHDRASVNDERFAKFLITPPEEKEAEIPEWLKNKGPDEAGGDGKRHRGEEGRMGKKTSQNKTGLYALKGPMDNSDPHLAKMLAEEQARSAGVLGILKPEEGSHHASIFGRDSTLGNDGENVLGGLVGTQIGEAHGVGGLGLVGTGRGGGGTGEGTIGFGPLGTIGRGGGGSGSGYGRGAGGLGGRRAHAPDVVLGTAQVRGSLDREIIRRIIRGHINEVKFCYERELARKPDLYGRVIVQFTIAGSGQVVASVVQQSTMNNAQVEQCIAGALRRWEFPEPQGGGIVIVSYPFVLKAAGGEDAAPELFGAVAGVGGDIAPPADNGAPAYTGKILEVMDLVGAKKLDLAIARARAWHEAEPGDVLALVALGNAWRSAAKRADAARAYGSIIDLFPARADLRRFAGDLLEGLDAVGEPLAADTFAHAVRDRADHPNSHRLRAYALLRGGHLREAFAAIEAGASVSYPEGRFRGVDQILREDAGLIGAAWLKRDPSQRASVEQRLGRIGASLPKGPSLRFVLSWETDANDVDFHIRDGSGNRAWFARPHLATGGDLYADVTTGYGPECFTIEGKPSAWPFRIQAHYYSRGPMGYGMGKVEIVEHDGRGGLRFDERSFVVMNDQAFVDLGTVDGPLPAK